MGHASEPSNALNPTTKAGYEIGDDSPRQWPHGERRLAAKERCARQRWRRWAAATLVGSRIADALLWV